MFPESPHPLTTPVVTLALCPKLTPSFLLPLLSVSAFFAFPPEGGIKLHWSWKSSLVKAGPSIQTSGVTVEQVQSVKNTFMKSKKKFVTTMCWWKKHQFLWSFIYLLASKWKSEDVKLTTDSFTNNSQSTSEYPMNHKDDRGAPMKTFCCAFQFYFGVLSGLPCY